MSSIQKYKYTVPGAYKGKERSTAVYPNINSAARYFPIRKFLEYTSDPSRRLQSGLLTSVLCSAISEYVIANCEYKWDRFLSTIFMDESDWSVENYE